VSSITGRKRSGALAAAGALLFLFNEAYTIFGGNWLSTFAGEFCFSWGIALLPLFAASTTADRRKGGKGIISGIILGLIGLCHFFVFMPAFFLPFFPAFGLIPELLKNRGKGHQKSEASEGPRIMFTILTTYIVAFFLMAFWLLPMVSTRPWAQSISIIWYFSSAKDFAVQTLAWIWAPASLVFLFAALSRRLETECRRSSALVLYLILACVFLFLTAPGLGVPDIRFVPTALLACVLGGAILIDGMLARIKPGNTRNLATGIAPAIVTFAFAAVACLGSALMARNSSPWFNWNYSGYQAKAQWPVIAELGEKYRGDTDSGRLLWEKQDQKDNQDFGSERAFENLFLFTGRPSSEGINYGSSSMARAATYLQSSYSLNPVDPEPERIYSEVTPDSWPASFSLLNAWGIIIHSKEIGERFAASKDFSLDSKIGKFTVYAYKGFAGHYVSVLPGEALSVVSPGKGGFRGDYYRFFREYRLYDLPFVSSTFADKALVGASGAAVYPDYNAYRGASQARAALGNRGEAGPAGKIRGEKVDNFEISFTTDSPGKPHYIRVSYAPGWKSSGGEKIYPAAPGFMVIVPKSSEIHLSYRRTIWEIIGLATTCLVLPLLLVLLNGKPRRNRRWKGLAIAAFLVFAGAACFCVLNTTRGYPALARDIGKARTLNLGKLDQRRKALELVGPWANEEMLERFDNNLVFDAFRITASAQLASGETDKAKQALDILKAHYPDTRALENLPRLP
ncbi:MAG: 6-pyruvoyl-tetrahydropterin synthase-related protein, partial [Spirochaetes bacterium]|nr:6-pyruvoyl-tetrahydropterin synthase-related protein [Spirochaetota bacterium]